jgi:predicted HTH domain antitoxin
MNSTLDDQIIRERDMEQLTWQTREAVLLYDYLTSAISLGEFAERMGMPLLDARDWLHKMGVSTSRSIRDPELTRSLEKDSETL